MTNSDDDEDIYWKVRKELFEFTIEHNPYIDHEIRIKVTIDGLKWDTITGSYEEMVQIRNELTRFLRRNKGEAHGKK